MPNLHEDKGGRPKLIFSATRAPNAIGGVGGDTEGVEPLFRRSENFGRRHQSVRDEDLRRVRTRST